MNRLKAGVAAAVLALTIAGPTAGAAFGGEVTGTGKPTPIRERAHSICAFSGKEDGLALIGFTPEGVPIVIEVSTGPGLVQNPHQENAAGIIHPPGIPGTACRGNGGGEV
jgi:hypothetical protein